MDKTIILRSAVGSTASLGIINELNNHNVKVIGIDSNPYSYGLYICDKGYVVPQGNDPEFINKIIEICKKEEVEAILTGPEEEMICLSQNKELFDKIGVKILLPEFETVDICINKQKLAEFFEKNEIPTPKTYDKIQIPCVIKPYRGRGGKDVQIIKNKQEIKEIEITGKLIQEYILGEEYTIDILCDKDSKPLSIIPRKRIQVESGISTKGKTQYEPEMIEYTKNIIKKLKLVGPACIQCIKNDKEIKFIEINLRFGGGSILSMKADSTIIPNLIRMIKGEKTIASEIYNQGLIMLRNYKEIFIKEKDVIK